MHKGRRLKPVRQPRGAEYVPLIPDSSPANRARGRNPTPTPPCASLSLESYHSPPPRLPGGVLRFSCALLTAHVAAIPRVGGHAPHVNIVADSVLVPDTLGPSRVDELFANVLFFHRLERTARVAPIPRLPRGRARAPHVKHDATTPAFPLREPFGARHPPTPVNGDDDARHRSKTGFQT